MEKYHTDFGLSILNVLWQKTVRKIPKFKEQSTTHWNAEYRKIIVYVMETERYFQMRK